MIFNSDINFSENDALVLNLAKKYFTEAKETINDLTNFEQVNYRIFVLCAFLGLTIIDDNEVDLYRINEIDKDAAKIKFSIPRTTLTQNISTIKDLLICADYSRGEYTSSETKLQRIWNMQYYSEDIELTNYIKEKAVLGAKYLVNLISVNNTNVLNVATNISKTIEKYEKYIDEEMVALEIEAEMLSHSE